MANENDTIDPANNDTLTSGDIFAPDTAPVEDNELFSNPPADDQPEDSESGQADDTGYGTDGESSGDENTGGESNLTSSFQETFQRFTGTSGRDKRFGDDSDDDFSFGAGNDFGRGGAAMIRWPVMKATTFCWVKTVMTSFRVVPAQTS